MERHKPVPTLPPYATRELVSERLPLIFPEGTPNRIYCVRELSARTVFAMLYIGAVETSGRHLAPKHVYRMTEEQASKADECAREAYGRDAMKPGFTTPGERWYADNTREPIRDETLREGLVAVGAVTAREDLPTTSSKPRYALKADFAALFDPALKGAPLEKAIGAFQATNLTPGALARISIMRSGAAGGTSGVLVTFPSGETRNLAPGPSSIISRAVIEVFAERFLEKAAVLWLSESGAKVVARDDRLATTIGLKIETNRNLPDLILADLGPAEPLIVFVEVVATDGAITQRRQEALFALTDEARFKRSQVAFLTAYQDRQSAGFKKTVSGLAWGSFAWFVSEPDRIVVLRDGEKSPARLADLLGIAL
jgi:hypothetical protein